MSTAAYEIIRATGTLPSPAGIALKILELTCDEDVTIEQLAAVIESDPSLASRLLKLVNSPLAGVSRRIASVAQAVTLLGLETVKGVALGFSLISAHKKGDCENFDYETFWSESAARAATARDVMNRLKDLPADEAFTCGLLCQIGRLAFATVYPQSYSAALTRATADDSGSLSKIEREMFQIDHNELAAEMMNDWHLPAVLCEAVRHQDSAEAVAPYPVTAKLARTLQFGGSVSVLLTRFGVRRQSLTTLTVQANHLGIGPAVVAAVFDSIREQWWSLGAVLAVQTRKVGALADLYTVAH